MPINTTSTMSANVPTEFFTAKLLDRLQKTLVLQPLGQTPVNIPKNSGNLVKWLRYAKTSASDPTAFLLSEGIVPTDIAITTYNVSATCLQYGAYALITDKLEWSAKDPILNSVSDVLSDQVKELIDTIIRTELDNNLPTQFANGKASLATTGVSDVLTAKEVLKGVVTLEDNDVKPFSDGMFRMIAAAKCKGDMMNDTAPGGFVDVFKYTNSQKASMDPGEIGECYGAKVMLSTNINSTTSGTLSSARVYSNLLLGKNCFGTAQLGPDTIQFLRQKPGGIADPLEQNNAVGYKLLGFVAKYLGGSGNGIADLGLRIRAGTGL